jgi:hypothetical protein
LNINKHTDFSGFRNYKTGNAGYKNQSEIFKINLKLAQSSLDERPKLKFYLLINIYLNIMILPLIIEKFLKKNIKKNNNKKMGFIYGLII